MLKNKDIEYTPVRIIKKVAPVVKKELIVNELDEDTLVSLNKTYKKVRLVGRLKRYFNTVAKFGIWYVVANVVIAIAMLVATLMGVDVIGWYTEVLGVN